MTSTRRRDTIDREAVVAHPGAASLIGPDPRSSPPSGRIRRLAHALRQHRVIYLLLLPGMLYFLAFHYVPLAGVSIAFMDYSPFLGLGGSTWSGLDNFAKLFDDPEFVSTVRNTLVISFLQIAFAFPAPILLALLLNSLLSERMKRMVQTVVYLPHFLSWVIVIAVWQQVLGGAGALADLFQRLGFDSVNVMANAETFKILLTSQVIWKDVGWGTIIFFAAIAAIPTQLYESAAVDGAGSLRRAWHITLPGILPVMVLLLILRLGNVLSVGFEQILLQQPSVGADAAQVLDTFVYFRGVLGGDWGIGAAAGLLKGAIGTLLIVAANRIARRAGSEGLF
ncbi:ABC transporter permease subunit [Nonomuraea fuscirosea]|uniref:ABC transporter permease n=1 Tax=Nonomuraea fuscirosea TaxID=1291556 RepID=UPI002DD8C276|nr:ABC transporter permease subunit [Nonomuraea fuscirosea]WSA53781.1 ABC transporter permease subunit [Nonomuraea fuscirosea]